MAETTDGLLAQLVKPRLSAPRAAAAFVDILFVQERGESDDGFVFCASWSVAECYCIHVAIGEGLFIYVHHPGSSILLYTGQVKVNKISEHQTSLRS